MAISDIVPVHDLLLPVVLHPDPSGDAYLSEKFRALLTEALELTPAAVLERFIDRGQSLHLGATLYDIDFPLAMEPVEYAPGFTRAATLGQYEQESGRIIIPEFIIVPKPTDPNSAFAYRGYNIAPPKKIWGHELGHFINGSYSRELCHDSRFMAAYQSGVPFAELSFEIGKGYDRHLDLRHNVLESQLHKEGGPEELWCNCFSHILSGEPYIKAISECFGEALAVVGIQMLERNLFPEERLRDFFIGPGVPRDARDAFNLLLQRDGRLPIVDDWMDRLSRVGRGPARPSVSAPVYGGQDSRFSNHIN